MPIAIQLCTVRFLTDRPVQCLSWCDSHQTTPTQLICFLRVSTMTTRWTGQAYTNKQFLFLQKLRYSESCSYTSLPSHVKRDQSEAMEVALDPAALKRKFAREVQGGFNQYKTDRTLRSPLTERHSLKTSKFTKKKHGDSCHTLRNLLRMKLLSARYERGLDGKN